MFFLNNNKKFLKTIKQTRTKTKQLRKCQTYILNQ